MCARACVSVVSDLSCPVQAANLSNISLGQSSDPGSPTPGSADMESQAAFEAGYEEKRMRLEEVGLPDLNITRLCSLDIYPTPLLIRKQT